MKYYILVFLVGVSVCAGTVWYGLGQIQADVFAGSDWLVHQVDAWVHPPAKELK